MKHARSADELIALITQVAQGIVPFVIAIDGFGGSGKTTLSKQLADKLQDAAILQIDDFIVTPDPTGTYPYDYDAFEETLRRIKTDESVISRTFDWKTHTKVTGETMKVKRFMIVDGVRLIQPRFLKYFHFTIWIDCPLDVAVERGKRRDREEQSVDHDALWDNSWKLLDEKHAAEHHPMEVADTVYEAPESKTSVRSTTDQTGIKAVIFDAGGVLHKSFAVKGDLAKEFNLDPQAIEHIWDKQIQLLGSGKIDEAEFWRQLRSEHGVRHVDENENLLGKKFAESVSSNIPVVALVRKLHKHGLKVAVLSNTIEPHAKALQESGMYDGFDTVILSHEVGMRKPDPKIYKHALAELEVQSQEAVFIDDDKNNVQAARALGMQGIVYSNPRQLGDALQELVPNLKT